MANKYVSEEDGTICIIPTSESNDVATLDTWCKGFIHGGMPQYLPAIIERGAMWSSNMMRSSDDHYKNYTLSSKDKNSNGDVVYFRFAPLKSFSSIISNINSSGSTKGMFAFIPLKNLPGLRVRSISGFDIKGKKGLNFDNEGLESIRNILEKNSSNNTEMQFIGESKRTDSAISINRISEWYIVRKERSITGGDKIPFIVSNGILSNMYNYLNEYNILNDNIREKNTKNNLLEKRAIGERIDISYFFDMLKLMMENIGYVKDENLYPVKNKQFIRYYRIGEPSLIMSSASIASSASSSSSSC